MMLHATILIFTTMLVFSFYFYYTFHECIIVFFLYVTANILGATELQGPLTYSYKDLKTATKNFSEENKLGVGGFGDVYKVCRFDQYI